MTHKPSGARRQRHRTAPPTCASTGTAAVGAVRRHPPPRGTHTGWMRRSSTLVRDPARVVGRPVHRHVEAEMSTAAPAFVARDSTRGRMMLAGVTLGSGWRSSTAPSSTSPSAPWAGPRRLARPAPVGRQRLPPRPRLARPRGWCAGRPSRAAPRLPRRRRVVHGRVGAVRPRPDPDTAHRTAGAAGRRGGAAHTRRALPHPDVVPTAGPGARDRHVGGAVRGGRGGGPGRRRVDRRPHDLAVDLRDQRAAVPARAVAHRPQRAGEPGRQQRRPLRRPRCRAHRPVAGGRDTP